MLNYSAGNSNSEVFFRGFVFRDIKDVRVCSCVFGGMLQGKEGRLGQSCEQVHDGVGVQGGAPVVQYEIGRGSVCVCVRLDFVVGVGGLYFLS